jgi:hypothetical protein
LVFVRAFYEDIARWVAEDPGRWAPWVAPCPIKAGEVTLKKFQSRVKSRMDQRTRTQLPLLPTLLRAVEQQRSSYIRECLVATSQAAQINAAGQPLQWRPHDFRRTFVTDAIRSGLSPQIAAKVC